MITRGLVYPNTTKYIPENVTGSFRFILMEDHDSGIPRSLHSESGRGGGQSFGQGNGGSERPSFECATARTATEGAICSNDELARFDRQLDSEFSLAVSNITSPAAGGTQSDVDDFRSSQKSWLARRNRCGADVACISGLYKARMRFLKEPNRPE